MSGKLSPSDIDFFDDRYIPEPNSGCWIWLGSAVGDGYAWMRGQKAYRFSYERYKGTIPDGLVIDHLCRNHLCVNPDHLEAVTHKVNILRGVGLAAVNAKKTHCIHGHPFDAKNTQLQQLRGGGVGRLCKTCQRNNLRKFRAKRAALSGSKE